MTNDFSDTTTDASADFQFTYLKSDLSEVKGTEIAFQQDYFYTEVNWFGSGEMAKIQTALVSHPITLTGAFRKHHIKEQSLDFVATRTGFPA